EDGLVTLKIYDILGNEVRTLVNESQSIGRYTIRFDASDLASGIYIYSVRVNDFVSAKKMILMK
ncbi:MAG TPA: T9SS type A sorting domain-containing protein, partial [Ignavibacteriaceae bacterium]|nr:T9SS type A sorting domain-containing protein [Ignavibacteriaceae bacterium]